MAEVHGEQQVTLYGYCADCDKTRALNVHGRCENCNSDAVMQRKGYVAPESDVEQLVRLWKLQAQ